MNKGTAQWNLPAQQNNLLASGYRRTQGGRPARRGGGAGVEHTVIGTGKMGDNLRLRLRLQYSAPCLAGMMGAYSKEVRFYTELTQHSSMRTPNIYHAMLSEAGTEFILLMEDLAPAEPGNQLDGETLAHAKLALTEAAKLHASFHRKTSLLSADFITKPAPDAAAFGQELLVQNWLGFIERFGSRLNAQCLAFGEHYIHRHAQWVASYRGESTLIHGDFRAENLLFTDSAVATVDWQTLAESFGLCDVAYFIGGSLTPDLRRTNERDLVEHYRQALAQHGVRLETEDCWQQYRLGSMHGIMITVLGAMFSAAEARSDRMFLTMIQRHLQHCVDLEAAALIP